MRPGRYVKFRRVVDDGDDISVMRVLEDRGPRVLVTDTRFSHWKIRPTSVYDKADLKTCRRTSRRKAGPVMVKGHRRGKAIVKAYRRAK